MVFDQGQVGDRFYIILQGSVKVEKPKLVEVSDAERDRRKTHYN